MITWTVTCEPVGGTTQFVTTESESASASYKDDEAKFAGANGATRGRSLTQTPLATIESFTESATNSSDFFFRNSDGSYVLEDSNSIGNFSTFTLSNDWRGGETFLFSRETSNTFSAGSFVDTNVASSFTQSRSRATTSTRTLTFSQFSTATTTTSAVTGAEQEGAASTASTSVQATTLQFESVQRTITVTTSDSYEETFYGPTTNTLGPNYGIATAFLLRNEIGYSATTLAQGLVRRESLCDSFSEAEFTVYPSVVTFLGQVLNSSASTAAEVSASEINFPTSTISFAPRTVAVTFPRSIPQNSTAENLPVISLATRSAAEQVSVAFTGPTTTQFSTTTSAAPRTYAGQTWSEIYTATTALTVFEPFLTSGEGSTAESGSYDPFEASNLNPQGASAAASSGMISGQWTRAEPVRHAFGAGMNARSATFQLYYKAFALPEQSTAGAFLEAGALTAAVPTWQEVSRTANVFVGSFVQAGGGSTQTVSAGANAITRTVVDSAGRSVQSFAYSVSGAPATVPQVLPAINPGSQAAAEQAVVVNLLPGIWFSTGATTSGVEIKNAGFSFYTPQNRVAYSAAPIAVPATNGQAFFTTQRNNVNIPAEGALIF